MFPLWKPSWFLKHEFWADIYGAARSGQCYHQYGLSYRGSIVEYFFGDDHFLAPSMHVEKRVPKGGEWPNPDVAVCHPRARTRSFIVNTRIECRIDCECLGFSAAVETIRCWNWKMESDESHESIMALSFVEPKWSKYDMSNPTISRLPPWKVIISITIISWITILRPHIFYVIDAGIKCLPIVRPRYCRNRSGPM
jgi:hypothetical protein